MAIFVFFTTRMVKREARERIKINKKTIFICMNKDQFNLSTCRNGKSLNILLNLDETITKN